jgi:hypothetical protein
MIVQEMVNSKAIAASGGTYTTVTLVLNHNTATRQPTIQITGLGTGNTAVLKGRLNPLANWVTFSTFTTSDVLAVVDLATEYQIVFTNNSASPLTVSAWMAN